MLEVKGISVFYDEVQAIRDASLEVREGEIVTMIGANGAGKTTMLKTISGLKTPASGEILFEGAPIHGLMPHAIVGRGVVQVPEGRRIFPNISVEENLKVGAHLVRDSARMRATMDRVYALFPRLKERRRQLGETLSGGEQQMLALGRAMMAQPRLLLLDEPSLGLAPIVLEEVSRSINLFRDAGITILLVEQNAQMALTLCDRGYVMETGRIVLTDTGSNLLHTPRVIVHYLGGAAEATVRAQVSASQAH
jgi:branched-chain amino acid transport system ATP-binding protein